MDKNKLKAKDRSQGISVISSAFMDNPSVNYVIRQGPNRERYVQELVRHAFDQCVDSPYSIKAPEDNGFILAHQRGKDRAGWRNWLSSLQVIWSATGLGGARRLLTRKGFIERSYPAEDFCYLWFIGVDPSAQGQQVGSRLLAELEELCYADQLPIYLETSNTANLPFYHRHGYETFHTITDEACGFPIYCLRKTVEAMELERRSAG